VAAVSYDQVIAKGRGSLEQHRVRDHDEGVAEMEERDAAIRAAFFLGGRPAVWPVLEPLLCSMRRCGYICPVCAGAGRVKGEHARAGDNHFTSCVLCYGAGVLRRDQGWDYALREAGTP
jgi:hypothetical protein